MHSLTSSEGPRLVRIAVPCAQTRVSIEMLSHVTEPRVKRETRSVLRHSVVVDSIERGRHHCSGEFEQLLLTYIEGCGLRFNTNRFKVRAVAASHYTND